MEENSVDLSIRSIDIFVGRDREIAEGNGLAYLRPPRPILNIYGSGGMGKTKLIVKIREGVSKVTTSSEIIDFYNTNTLTELGLLSTIAQSLGRQIYEAFFTDFDVALTDYQNSSPAERYSLHTRAVNIFKRCYENASEMHTIFLFFDTFDREFAESPLAENFVCIYLPWLRQTNTCIVISGRQKLEHSVLSRAIKWIMLQGFTKNETIEFAKRKFEILGIPYNIKAYIIDRIVALSEGRPILIALTFDWILTNVDPHKIISIPKDEFEATLVSWIQNLDSPEDEAILYMAVLSRRFDLDLLHRLTDLPLESCQHIFEHLAKFSFIKYLPFSKSCVLHDEMRDMVNRHVGLPPETTKWVRKIALKYYKDRISKTKDELERRSLIAEWLFNSFLVSPKLGFSIFVKQFEVAHLTSDLELCRSLITEVSKVDLSIKQLNVLILFKAELKLAEYSPKEAYGLLDGLRSAFAKDKPLLGRVLLDMGFALALQGEMTQAAEFMSKSRDIFTGLNDSKNIIKASSALGDLYFWVGHYARAIPYLEEALELCKESNDTHAVINVLGTLGNVRRRQGLHKIALDLCEDAKQLVEKEGSEIELANSLRSLGNIKRDKGNFDEACTLYEQALNIFRDANDRLGTARTLSEYAWCMFVFSKSRKDKSEASTLLGKAKDFAYESIKIKTEYSFNNELAATYHTLFEIACIEEGPKSAYPIIEKVYSLAERYNDGYMIFDGLHHLAVLDFNLANSKELIKQRADEMQRLTSLGFSFPLFEGRVNNILGNMTFDDGDFKEALIFYKRGYKMIADLEGTATGMSHQELLNKELLPLRERITKLPLDVKEEFCLALRDWCIEQGLGQQYLGLFSECE